MITIIGLKFDILQYFLFNYEKYIQDTDGCYYIKFYENVGISVDAASVVLNFEGDNENVLRCDFYRIELE